MPDAKDWLEEIDSYNKDARRTVFPGRTTMDIQRMIRVIRRYRNTALQVKAGLDEHGWKREALEKALEEK